MSHKMARHNGPWAETTARVLTQLRNVSQTPLERTDREQAAINKVWAFVGVGIDEYDRSGKWKNVVTKRRERVRQRLHEGFLDDAAFLPDGRAARDAFTREHLLNWGDRLLRADATASASAAEQSYVSTDEASMGADAALAAAEARAAEANAALAAAEARAAVAEARTAAAEDRAAAAEACAAATAAELRSRDDVRPRAAAMAPVLDGQPEDISSNVRVSIELAHLPAGDRLTIKRIIERASAEGYEIENLRGLLSYARSRYVEAEGEFRAVDSAMDMFGGLALDVPAPPSDEDLTESSCRSDRSDRTHETRLSAQIRKSDFAFMSRALLKLESDLHAGRIKLDQIHREMGLKNNQPAAQQLGRVKRDEYEYDV